MLSLGNVPLANALLNDQKLQQTEERFPLDLVFCPDCTLVQITVTVPPEKLFGEYAYFSSFSETMLRHARAVTAKMRERVSLTGDSLVIELASNDGYLLQYYQQQGVPVLGIEPARNIAEYAEKQKGIPTLCEFFGEQVARNLADQGTRADVIHANNVLAHVAELNDFVAGIAALLKPTGVAVIEAPYLKDFLDNLEFDTVYHEHLCYFSATALTRLFARHGLLLQDVERLPIHGGSLRLFVRHQTQSPPRTQAVEELLREEQTWGVATMTPYRQFAQDVTVLQQELKAFLTELKARNKRVAVYGASAKGSTLMNSCGITAEMVDYVVDRSTVKQGQYTPGNHLKIYPPEKLAQDRPDYTLLLTWNFAEEILAQQQEYRRQGGQFIFPLPQIKIA